MSVHPIQEAEKMIRSLLGLPGEQLVYLVYLSYLFQSFQYPMWKLRFSEISSLPHSKNVTETQFQPGDMADFKASA